MTNTATVRACIPGCFRHRRPAAPGSAGGFVAFVSIIISAIGSSLLGAPPTYPNHQDLSFYIANGTRVPIRTPDDWQQRRAHILAAMQEVMGPLPRPKKRTPV